MENTPVIRLKQASIYHAADGRSLRKMLRDGEMVLSEVDLEVRSGEFVYLIGRVGLSLIHI